MSLGGSLVAEGAERRVGAAAGRGVVLTADVATGAVARHAIGRAAALKTAVVDVDWESHLVGGDPSARAELPFQLVRHDQLELVTNPEHLTKLLSSQIAYQIHEGVVLVPRLD